MDPINITYDVTPLAQTRAMSCWAAAGAMLVSWHTGAQCTELQAAQAAGAQFEAAFNADTGLAGPDVSQFAAGLALVPEAPQNWTPQGYVALLKSHGPLWVGASLRYGDVLYRHVRILRGLAGDGSIDQTIAFIVDPDGGRDYQGSLDQFASEVEAFARQDLGAGRELDPQVLHYA